MEVVAKYVGLDKELAVLDLMLDVHQRLLYVLSGATVSAPPTSQGDLSVGRALETPGLEIGKVLERELLGLEMLGALERDLELAIAEAPERELEVENVKVLERELEVEVVKALERGQEIEEPLEREVELEM